MDVFGGLFVMRRLLSLGLGLVFVGAVSQAGAQGITDLATRSVSATASATIPASPGQVASAGSSINGRLDTHLLDLSGSAHIVYDIVFGPVSAQASGLTNGFPATCCVAAAASVWFNGTVNDRSIWTNGFENGYGNEFQPWYVSADEVHFPSYFTPGASSVDYVLSAGASVPLSGQSAGASGTATASARLAGAYAVSSNGTTISTAIFDDQGNGYFTASTPEPSSLALLSTGLLGIVPVYQRRRRAQALSNRSATGI
jgi:hypothetical protein